MSTAIALPAWPALATSTTVRQFIRALLWVAGLLGVAVLLHLVEKYPLGLERRFVESPADVMMRTFAFGHFIVGWLFLATSPRIRSRDALERLALATAVGVALCTLFAWLGGTRNPLLLMFFYGYFLVHEIRDETQLYQIYGDAPPVKASSVRLLPALRRAACLVLMLTLAGGYLGYAFATGKGTSLQRVPTWVFVGGLSFLVLLCGWALHQLHRRVQEQGGGWGELAASHRPLLAVYLLILVTLLGGSFLGSTGLNLIIMLHVASWLVFVQHQLGKRPQTMQGGLWNWLRSTPTGFLTLHLGIMAGVLVLMALRVYAWQRVGFLSELLASQNFCYWALMHISMSFWSSK